MKHFHYTDDVGVIRITCKKQPGEKTAPRSGTWVVRELNNLGAWEMPTVPQITWGTLKKMIYLGNVPDATVKEEEKE